MPFRPRQAGHITLRHDDPHYFLRESHWSPAGKLNRHVD
jgi:hypothetical protein